MKRLCVFAHWDRDNIIDDYVIYYLNALKEVCSTIIFVSDCNLESNEIAKLNGIIDYVIAQKHNEYDFGSYKRGFLFIWQKSLIPKGKKNKEISGEYHAGTIFLSRRTVLIHSKNATHIFKAILCFLIKMFIQAPCLITLSTR